MNDKLSQKGDSNVCPIAFIIKNDQILLGFREYKSGSNWTCPGGRCDSGETLEETLRREVCEEIGVKNLFIKEYIGEVKGAWGDDVVPIFICEIKEDPVLMEPHKFREWKWFGKKDLPDNFVNRLAKDLIEEVLHTN